MLQQYKEEEENEENDEKESKFNPLSSQRERSRAQSTANNQLLDLKRTAIDKRGTFQASPVGGRLLDESARKTAEVKEAVRKHFKS